MNATSQQVIKFHPSWIFSKIRFQYESVRNEKISIGLLASLHYAWFKGFQIGPMAKLYIGKKEAPNGTYLQVQSQFFSMSCTHTFYVMYTNFFEEFVQQTKKASGVGFGFGFGKQWIFGSKNNFVIDAMIGLKYHRIPTHAFYFSYVDKNEIFHENLLPKVIWYLTGPGSLLNNHLAIGYLF
jgi:hypothetical protein